MRDLPIGRRQSHERIVLHRHGPEVGLDSCRYLGELGTNEPTREVDEVNPLVEKLATPCFGGIGAPFLFVTDASTVAVAGAHEHDVAAVAVAKNRVRLLRGGVEAMIVANFDDHTFCSSELRDRLELGRGSSRGLLENHVL